MINREIIYERTMVGSYMKIPMGIHAGLDEKLMLRRSLKGTIPVEKTYVDGSGQYWYNISGKQSLDTYCRMKQVGAEFVERLIIGICNELEILEWNLIHTNCLMLDPELIFLSTGSKEFYFTIYPGTGVQIDHEFQQLVEYLLTKLDHKDELAVKRLYGVYEKTLEDGYSVMDLRSMIIQSKREQAIRITDTQENEYTCDQAPYVIRENHEYKAAEAISGFGGDSLEDHWTSKKNKFRIMREKKNVNKKEKKKKEYKEREKKRGTTETEISRIFTVISSKFQKKGQPEVLPVIYPEEERAIQPKMCSEEEVYATICLTNMQGKPRGILMYQGNEQLQDISLGTGVTRIGHGVEMEAVIDRPTISQYHARIEYEDGIYYIEDLNSTNGTSVNEETLVYKQRYQLKVGDLIRIADVGYRFT